MRPATTNSSLLRVFLQYERNPKAIILWLDRSQPLGLNYESLQARVTRSGLWSFRKVPLDYCEQSQDQFTRTEYDGLDLCIETHLVDEPPRDAIRADYRTLYYRVPVALFRAPQQIAIRVLSLYRGELLMGRSISANLNAGPFDVGRTDLNCTQIAPVAFEGVE